MSGHDPLDERLARLQAATASIGASRGFAERVMQAVAADPSAGDEILRIARRWLPLTAIAAGIAAAWALSSASSVDRALAMDDEIVELEW